MKKRYPSSLTTAILATMVFLAAGARGWAQADFEKGYQGFQTYHGSSFDNVNLANGNLILDIPLLSYEQRGDLPPIVISIRSNSTTFQSGPQYVNGPPDTKQYEMVSGIVGAPWGQPHVSITPGGLTWHEERVLTQNHTPTSPEYLSRFVALDESGATHSLGGSVANTQAGYIPDIRYSVDGSGLMLQPGTATTGPVIVDRKGNVGGLVDTNGNAITLQGRCARAPGSGNFYDPTLGSWQGYAMGTASATSIVDSIGRVIPNPSYVEPLTSYGCVVDMAYSYHAQNIDPTCPVDELGHSQYGETFQFPGEHGGTVPLSFCYDQIAVNAILPRPAGASIAYETINETWWVLTSVTLPNQTKWVFHYQSNPGQPNYGQVDKIITPTGAVVQYEYQTRLACGNPPGETPVTGSPIWPYSNLLSSQMVSQRTITVPNGPTQTWTYDNEIGSGWLGGPQGQTGEPYYVKSTAGANQGKVTVTDPANNQTVHTFSLIDGTACGPYETQTDSYDSLQVLLKRVRTVYTDLGADSANPINFSNYIAVSVFPQSVQTSLYDSGQSVTSTTNYKYDSYGTYQDYLGGTHQLSLGLLQQVQEYDWGSSSPARTTNYTKLWQSNFPYYSQNMIDLPLEEILLCGTATTSSVCPSPGGIASKASYVYDEPAYSSATGMGNLTSTTHWLFGSPSSPTTHLHYTLNGYGMPQVKEDAKGYLTTITYDSTGLYPRRIDYPNGSYETSSFDKNTGLLETSTDVNQQTTSFTYDAMRRATLVQHPDGGSESYCFMDVASAPCSGPGGSVLSLSVPAFTFQKVIDSTNTMFLYGQADGLGRAIQKVLLSDPYGPVRMDTQYDALGRVQSVSNPYRTMADTTYGTTTYAYDGLSRKTIEYNPDMSYQTWTYNLNTAISQDENGNQVARTTDAMGRLTSVLEPNGSSVSPSMPTTYTYDASGNLLSVAQVGNPNVDTPRASRSYTYDSLSRLVTSSNPETGTICYGSLSGSICNEDYDANGNLQTKTDARSVVTQMHYDNMNRLISKSFSNDPQNTLSSCFEYGTVPSAVNRLVASWTQSGGCTPMLTCTYLGDSVYETASCNGVEVTVSAAASTLTLSSAQNPSYALASTFYTARLTVGGHPAGTGYTVMLAALPSGSTVSANTDSTGSASFSETFDAGSYGLTASVAGSATMQAASATLTQVVQANPTASTLSSSASTVAQGQAVVFSAVVTSLATAASPVGTVMIFDGTMPLGTVTLSKASGNSSLGMFTTSSLSVGVHTLSAVYTPGSADFAAGSSATISESVSISDFSIQPGASTVSVQTGHNTSFPVTVTSVGAFAGAVTLSCGASPATYLSCGLPPSAQLTANGSATFQVTIETDEIPNFLAGSTPQGVSAAIGGKSLALVVLPLLCYRRRKGLRRSMMAVVVLLAMGISGCTGKYPGHTPPGTYAISVQGVGGASQQHSVSVSLVVTP